MNTMIARIGCYKNDHYSSQQFVHCLCDCDVKSKPTCMWCNHYHEAPAGQIVVTPNTAPTQHTTLTIPLTVEKALKNMAVNYKRLSLQLKLSH